MKSKKVLSLLITCAMTASMGTTVFASTEDQIAAAQAQKQEGKHQWPGEQETGTRILPVRTEFTI